MRTKTINWTSGLESEEALLNEIKYGITTDKPIKSGDKKYKVSISVREVKRKNGFNRKRSDLQKLKDKLWKFVSEYVRRRDGGKCFTCGTVKPWKEMQAGHFIPQSLCNTEFKYAEWNIHCQCYSCNVGQDGNYVAYSLAMEKKYGNGICDHLQQENKQNVSKWNIRDYEEAIELYKEKLRSL